MLKIGQIRVSLTSNTAEMFSFRSGERTHWSAVLLLVCLVLYHLFFLGMVAIGAPEREVSIGFHQKTGPCDHYTEVKSSFGAVSSSSFRHACRLCPRPAGKDSPAFSAPNYQTFSQGMKSNVKMTHFTKSIHQ